MLCQHMMQTSCCKVSTKTTSMALFHPANHPPWYYIYIASKRLASIDSSGSFPSGRYCTMAFRNVSSYCRLTICLNMVLAARLSSIQSSAIALWEKHEKHYHLVPLVTLIKCLHLFNLVSTVKFCNSASPLYPSSRWMLFSKHGSEF